MTKRALKPGDVVMVKSGGPTMTITSIDGKPGPSAVCVWFQGEQDELRTITVPVAALALEDDDEEMDPS